MNNKTKLIPRKLIGGLIPKFEEPAGKLTYVGRIHGKHYARSLDGSLYHVANPKTLKLIKKVTEPGQILTSRFFGSTRAIGVDNKIYSGTRGKTALDNAREAAVAQKTQSKASSTWKTTSNGTKYIDYGDGTFSFRENGKRYNAKKVLEGLRIQSESVNKPVNQNSDVKGGGRRNGGTSSKVNGSKPISTSTLSTSTSEITYTPTVPKGMEYASNYLTASPENSLAEYEKLSQSVKDKLNTTFEAAKPTIFSTDPYEEMMNAMKGWDLKRKQKMMDASVGTAWDWNTEEGRKAFTGMAQYLKNGKGDYQKAYDLYLASQNTPKLETPINNFYARMSNDIKNMKLNLPEFKFTFNPESSTFAQLPQLNLKLNTTNNTPFVNYSGPDAWLDDLSWKKDLNSAYNRYLSTFARKGVKLIKRNK